MFTILSLMLCLGFSGTGSAGWHRERSNTGEPSHRGFGAWPWDSGFFGSAVREYGHLAGLLAGLAHLGGVVREGGGQQV